MELTNTNIQGCYRLQPLMQKDIRGAFIKTFRQDIFEYYGLATVFAEEYYTVSKKNVLRGLHFQTPPFGHNKLAYCIAGEVMDVLLDLRRGSPTFQQYQVFYLNDKESNMLYIPEGIAHGFYVLSETATMMYKVTSIYSPENDSGILWKSIQLLWPSSDPIISERDNGFIALDKFDTPFTFAGNNL